MAFERNKKKSVYTQLAPTQVWIHLPITRFPASFYFDHSEEFVQCSIIMISKNIPATMQSNLFQSSFESVFSTKTKSWCEFPPIYRYISLYINSYSTHSTTYHTSVHGYALLRDVFRSSFAIALKTLWTSWRVPWQCPVAADLRHKVWRSTRKCLVLRTQRITRRLQWRNERKAKLLQQLLRVWFYGVGLVIVMAREALRFTKLDFPQIHQKAWIRLHVYIKRHRSQMGLSAPVD